MAGGKLLLSPFPRSLKEIEYLNFSALWVVTDGVYLINITLLIYRSICK